MDIQGRTSEIINKYESRLGFVKKLKNNYSELIQSTEVENRQKIRALEKCRIGHSSWLDNLFKKESKEKGLAKYDGVNTDEVILNLADRITEIDAIESIRKEGLDWKFYLTYNGKQIREKIGEEAGRLIKQIYDRKMTEKTYRMLAKGSRQIHKDIRIVSEIIDLVKQDDEARIPKHLNHLLEIPF